MKSVFVSHGAPSLELEPSPAREFLSGLGRTLGAPSAIVVVSAHWEESPPHVTSSPRPETIHDFAGFPRELYALRYPAPGDPALAARIVERLAARNFAAQGDSGRGLDHGAWVPLRLMYPQAQVPVVQVSLPAALGAPAVLELGRALRPLRSEGVLVLGSGGATHNLREIDWAARDAPAPAWAREFEAWLVAAVERGDEGALVEVLARAPQARRNHPTSEHYLPLLAVLGAASKPAGMTLHRSWSMGSLSMAAFGWE